MVTGLQYEKLENLWSQHFQASHIVTHFSNPLNRDNTTLSHSCSVAQMKNICMHGNALQTGKLCVNKNHHLKITVKMRKRGL